MDNDQNPVVFTGPLFACSYGHCAEEVSYPADMLRIYEGQLWCEGCWDSSEHVHTRWCDLQAFVPPWEKHIATLTAERDALREALEAAVECGMVPDSGVSDGGLFRHSRQGQAADMIRAALSREGE